jgi:hypothetical protein
MFHPYMRGCIPRNAPALLSVLGIAPGFSGRRCPPDSIDLGCQNEIVFRESFNCMSPEDEFDLVVMDLDVWMVPFFLGNVGNFIHEHHGGYEVGELELPD